MFLTANNVQATAEIAASNLDVLVSGISAIAAIIAGIAALVGVIIGTVMGASSARKTKVTEVYFEKKYVAYCDLIAAIAELRISGDNFNLSLPFPVLSKAAILSSPKTYKIIK